MKFSRRSDMVRLAEEICEAVGVPIPSIMFRDTHINKCGRRHIDIVSPEWMLKNHGGGEKDGFPTDWIDTCYQQLLIHELAHWIEQAQTGHTRHSPTMYAIFFTLIKRWEFSLEEALGHEAAYKPRAAVQGWKLYQEWRSGLTPSAIPMDNAVPADGQEEAA